MGIPLDTARLWLVLASLAVIILCQPTSANFYCHLCEGDNQGSCNFYRADVTKSGKPEDGKTSWYVHCSDKGEVEKKTMIEDDRLKREKERGDRLEQSLSSCQADKQQILQGHLSKKDRQNAELRSCSDETHRARFDAKDQENRLQREHLLEKAGIQVDHAKCQKDSEAYQTLQSQFEIAQKEILRTNRYLAACSTLIGATIVWMILRWVWDSFGRLTERLWGSKKAQANSLEYKTLYVAPSLQAPDVVPGYMFASPVPSPTVMDENPAAPASGSATKQKGLF